LPTEAVMNLLSRLLLISAAMLTTPALADPNAQQLAAAKEAEVRGAEIYAYDQAAWHSTDRFQSDLKKANLTLEQAVDQGVRGYVVERLKRANCWRHTMPKKMVRSALLRATGWWEARSAGVAW
jgi:hypothetical protein